MVTKASKKRWHYQVLKLLKRSQTQVCVVVVAQLFQRVLNGIPCLVVNRTKNTLYVMPMRATQVHFQTA